MAMPMMPRSSSGEFQAVLSPCVAVKTPPERRPDVLAENVGDAQMRFAVVQRQTHRLHKSRHPPRLRKEAP